MPIFLASDSDNFRPIFRYQLPSEESDIKISDADYLRKSEKCGSRGINVGHSFIPEEIQRQLVQGNPRWETRNQHGDRMEIGKREKISPIA
jgi:hypothetical protein